MRAVIVDGDVSYPPTSGKRLRTLHLMLRMARTHRISYIARCDRRDPEVGRAERFLSTHGIEPIFVDDPLPSKSGPLFYARLAANMLSPLPYSVASHQTWKMRRVVRQFAARREVDLWQFEWAPYLSMLDPSAPGARVVIAHNVDTLIWQRYYENATHPLKRLFLAQQWRKFARFEGEAFSDANCVVAVSEDDATLLRRQFDVPWVEVVDNGIDSDYFESVVEEREPWTILFLGALDWRPNQDAISLLLDRIYPEIRQLEARARLNIVGRNPPSWLVGKVGSLEHIDLHANVPDVRPFLGRNSVMAVPLRIGGGSRLKILEALACGMPVVATPVAAEGLRLDAGIDYVAATETDFARALVDVLRCPNDARQVAEHGKQVVLEHYDWDVLADKLEQVWQKCVHVEAQAVL